ncbi:MAG: hypothetical protein Q7S66_01765 [bacterium]|nr:hypothetical protein [bacterium]
MVKEGDLEALPVLTIDNIEIAKNEEGKRTDLMREVYQQFFREYLENYAQQMQVSRTTVPIGTGYTPSDIGFRSAPNTYIPTAPAGYSDNVHADCFVLDTGLPEITQPKGGMTALDVRDAISVAVLEGKAYSDNANLVENLHKMQNNLIGMAIANRHFNRPNLSFMYKDAKNAPRGYVLAYEGVYGGGYEEGGNEKGKPFVYIDVMCNKFFDYLFFCD